MFTFIQYSYEFYLRVESVQKLSIQNYIKSNNNNCIQMLNIKNPSCIYNSKYSSIKLVSLSTNSNTECNNKRRNVCCVGVIPTNLPYNTHLHII